MSTRTRIVTAKTLSESSWAPFGWIPRRDTDPLDGESRLAYSWNDAHANLICHRRDELGADSEGLNCQKMFHHRTHTQVLLVLNCDAVIAAARADLRFDRAEDLEEVEAFLLHPHDSLVIAPGVWHWGPFPVAEPQVDLFNIQGLRYAEDNEMADLGRFGGVEVSLR